LSDKEKKFIYSQNLDLFPYPPTCPFNTSRAGQAKKILDSMSLFTGPDREVVAPVPTDRATLEKFHGKEYLDNLEKVGLGTYEEHFLHFGLGTGDCPAFKGVYDFCLWAAGATITAAKLIIDGKARITFNPSGGFHHAGADYASGFCYVNDVVLGCMELTKAGKKVLYLDIDVHHGDGVQNAFCTRNDVLTISFHQSGNTLFPGTGFPQDIGEDDGKGYSVNVPLPPGTYDEIYLKAIKEIVLPLIKAYDPDCFVVEIGTDALAGDPLANLSLTNNVYVDVIEMLLKFDIPILAVGGGGYNIENTVRAWCLAWAIMCGDDTSGHETLGLGGVMLQSTEWQGGLRDTPRHVAPETVDKIAPLVDEVISQVKKNVFSYHAL
jgi:acetoin utilization protein AcuC